MVQALSLGATYWCSGLECNHTCCLLLLRQWQGDNGEDLTQTVSQLCVGHWSNYLTFLSLIFLIFLI